MSEEKNKNNVKIPLKYQKLDKIQVGELFKEKRNSLGLTMVKVAKELGLTRGYVNNLEHGYALPFSRLRQLCQFYGLDYDAVVEKYTVLDEEKIRLDIMRLENEIYDKRSRLEQLQSFLKL